MTADDLVQVLKQIYELRARPFKFPSDFLEKIAACSECQFYKNHPIQNGICNKHRQPLWDRERHDQVEQETLGYRCQDLAANAIERFNRENKPIT